MKYIQLFNTTLEYNAAKDNLILPNVSVCKDQSTIYINPYVDPVNNMIMLRLVVLSGQQ